MGADAHQDAGDAGVGKPEATAEPHWEPRAIVVVHGIGVQAPRATLQAFIEGLEKHVGEAKITNPEVRQAVKFGEKVSPAPARLEWQDASGTIATDVYEVYWAPRASRKTTARSVLGWVLRLTFIPGAKMRLPRWKNVFDALGMFLGVGVVSVLLLWTLLGLVNLTTFAKCVQPDRELSDRELALCELAFEELEPRISPTGFVRRAGLQQSIFEASAELARLGDVGGVLWRALDQVPGQVDERTLRELSVSDALDVARAIPLSQLLWLAVLVWVTAQIFFRLGQIAVTGTWGRRLSAVIGLVAQLLALVAALQYSLIAGAAVVVALVVYRLWRARQAPTVPTNGSNLKRMVSSVSSSVNAGFVLLGVVVVAVLAQITEPIYAAFAILLAAVWFLVRATSGFLSESIGDVQVYTSRNPNSPHYAAREEILSDAERVFQTLVERDYQSIVVVGHSLGAVVALEAVENLSYRIPVLSGRIRGFVTLGAALEKVKYFFSQDPGRESAGLGTATEEATSGKSIPEKRLDDAVETFDRRPWLNLWYWNDMVADPVYSFGRLDQQPRYRWFQVNNHLEETLEECRGKLVVNIRFGSASLWSHGRYWFDPRIIRVIGAAASRWMALPPTPSPQPVQRVETSSLGREEGG